MQIIRYQGSRNFILALDQVIRTSLCHIKVSFSIQSMSFRWQNYVAAPLKFVRPVEPGFRASPLLLKSVTLFVPSQHRSIPPSHRGYRHSHKQHRSRRQGRVPFFQEPRRRIGPRDALFCKIALAYAILDLSLGLSSSAQ